MDSWLVTLICSLGVIDWSPFLLAVHEVQWGEEAAVCMEGRQVQARGLYSSAALPQSEP